VEWLVLLAIGVGAMWVAFLGFRRVRRSTVGIGTRIVLWGSALIFGCAAAIASYPLDARTRALGFPLPAVVFQQGSDGIWRDFLGLTTPLFMAIDATVGAGLGLFAVSKLAEWMRSRRPKGVVHSE
jgi:hypothetical protein